MRKLKPSQIVGTALLVGGVTIISVAAYNMTVGDELARVQQQAAAETVPLAGADGETGTLDGKQLEIGDVFAKLYVPRFGEDYVRNIAEGTSLSKVLNTVGIGHYSGTAMPGEVGNFALAGHRSGNGGPMRDIDKFVPGDLVFVETASTRYTYKFVEGTTVKPSGIGVIAPVPVGMATAVEGGKYLTMTSCTPIGVNTDRIIAWFELVEQQPASN
ncbi:class E sortase [Rhodoluna limnophila]|uniref:class E sortase n=1 Tax=Rhodoluna limnophila TaxID=232537 RepID=UPI0015620513|nr:class E sortase [Rhodoluna limnophila]